MTENGSRPETDRSRKDGGRTEMIRKTTSVCPVCYRKIPAALERDGEKGIFLKKTCPDHGSFRTAVWHDRVSFEEWIKREQPLSEAEMSACSGDCSVCSSHGQGTCCVLLEVTQRCNLHCRYCFADGGGTEADPPKEDIFRSIDAILKKAPGVLLQLSGGEPTLRDDLPEIVAYAKEAGCGYVQINTNGIRLAEEPAFVKQLAEAGADIAFLQFDGTDDAVYETLRGRKLFEVKCQAIRNCAECGIGVTLVPTVVRGVNDRQLGNIVQFALSMAPAVRGIHFQPVTYLGRHPDTSYEEHGADRYTLDDLIADLCEETGMKTSYFVPSRCDHALCGFHGTFLAAPDGQLTPLSDQNGTPEAGCCCTPKEEPEPCCCTPKQEPEPCCCVPKAEPEPCCCAPKAEPEPCCCTPPERTSAEKNRNFIGSHWKMAKPEEAAALRPVVSGPVSFGGSVSCGGPVSNGSSISYEGPVRIREGLQGMDVDDVIRNLKTRTLIISSMAFQDAENLNLERMYRCSLHVYDRGRLVPFCYKYLKS